MAASLIGRLSGSLCRIGSSLIRPSVPNVSRQLLPSTELCQTTGQRTLMTPAATAGIPTVATCKPPGSLLQACQPLVSSVRTKIRYSIRRGKPKPVKAVIYRFYRLHWGIYIRPRPGRHKHRWRKPDWILDQAKYHVFCNKQQSRLLDKMTTRFWKKKRHYPEDPYTPYQKRTNMPGHHNVPKFLP